MSARDFDRAATAFVKEIRDSGRISARDMVTLRSGLTRLLKARFPRLDALEAESIASDAVSAYWHAAERGLVDLDKRPAAYLTVIAINAARGALSHVPEPIADGLDEGEEDARLDAVLAHETAIAALDSIRCHAIDNNDFQAVRVITAWLDLAEESGSAPTTRQVAEAADVSHATVGRVLDRLSSLL